MSGASTSVRNWSVSRLILGCEGGEDTTVIQGWPFAVDKADIGTASDQSQYLWLNALVAGAVAIKKQSTIVTSP
jgi:hypothetical protein